MSYSPLHYNLLLAHMLKTPAVMTLAVKHVEPAFFTSAPIGGTYAQAVIFEIISTHHKQFSVAPDPATLMIESRRIFSQFLVPGQQTESLREVIEFIRLVSIADDRSAGLARELVMHIHNNCVHKVAIADAADALHSGSPAAEIGSRLLELERKAKSLLGTTGHSGVSTMQLRGGVRMRTGIPFIDSRLGGGDGPMTGCAIGIIAPQAAGKTTFGIQLSISQALLGKPTLLVLAEEGLSLPLRRNLLACATGIPTTILEKFENADGVTNMVEAATAHKVDVDTVLAKIAQVDKNLHVLDLNESPGAIPEIETEIQHMGDRGMLPSYIYIDWAGMLADRIMSTGMGGVQFPKKYDALKAISYNVARLAHKFNAQVAVAQQMAPDVAKKGPLNTADMFCAADCRGFTEPFKYVFTINARDKKTGLSLCRIVKARNDPPGIHFPLKLAGEIAQFEDMGALFSVENKRFKPISTKQGPVVPKEG